MKKLLILLTLLMSLLYCAACPLKPSFNDKNGTQKLMSETPTYETVKYNADVPAWLLQSV
jgi:hypothetical protein